MSFPKYCGLLTIWVKLICMEEMVSPSSMWIVHIVRWEYWFWLLHVFGTLKEGFQSIQYCLSGLTMWNRLILIHANGGNKNVSCLQIILNLLFITVGPIGLMFNFCNPVNFNLRFGPLVDHGVPNIHVDWLNMEVHAFFPIFTFFAVKNWSPTVLPLRLFVHHIDSLGS